MKTVDRNTERTSQNRTGSGAGKFQIDTGTIIICIGILLIGIYLRFDRLTTVPPSLSHDETAITYNAYSILKTGKDEYGIRLPLLFRSFDDYKLPGMVYSTVPAVALFGLTELSARLPSFIFGVFSILVMYGLAIELLGDKRWLALGKRKFDSALLPTFMFAVQPWHINFSRQLFESNGAVFWFMLATYVLLRSRRNYKEILMAGLFYVTSLYFYYSVRLVIPFIGLVYLLLFRKKIIREWKTTVVTLAVCIIAFLPMGREMLSPGGMERISIVSVVNDPNYLKLKEEYVKKFGTNPTLVNKIIYNRRVALVRTVFDNYGKNISPRNLFITGTGTYGALYPFESILIPLGILSLFSLSQFSTYLIIVWALTAFLPGAFSVNQPNTLRTLIAAPVFAILSGLGIYRICLFILDKRRNQIVAFFVMVILFSLFAEDFPRFHDAYFVDNPTKNAIAFGDGYKQMVTYVKAHETEYDRIYISGYYWRPYIFFLYWGNVNPTDYQRSGSREILGKYIFTAASWDTNGIKLMDSSFDPNTLHDRKNTLYILSDKEYNIQMKHFRLIEKINGRHAEHVFIAAVQQ